MRVRNYRLPLLTATLLVCLLPISQRLAHSAMSETEIENWPNNKTDDLPTEKIASSTLRFLVSPPKSKVHHHHNTLIIGNQSLNDGWVVLQQCHEHLDIFPRVQILYQKEKVRNIRITSSENVERAWVENVSVQMTNVAKNARLCITAESKSLAKNADGSFTLHTGPFMRKFLDGFFPMRVSLNLMIPKQLRFDSVTPVHQNGFAVSQSDISVGIEAWFEGKLNTQIRLVRVK